jgi:hypothetical protein
MQRARLELVGFRAGVHDGIACCRGDHTRQLYGGRAEPFNRAVGIIRAHAGHQLHARALASKRVLLADGQPQLLGQREQRDWPG